MTYEELKNINGRNASEELLEKVLSESNGLTMFYKEQLKLTGDSYWKGKLGHQAKQRKLILEKLETVRKS